MIRVKNRKVISSLSRKSMKANRSRNLVAILAIALTTILFTALFTIALSINAGFQDANFRQAGGWSHGVFKALTEEQYDNLKSDSKIKEWGLRRFLGMPVEAPFNKEHVEIGYSDANQAHWMYCDPVEGRLPKEGTTEAATDTRVLEKLGIQPKLGEKFTVTFKVDGKEITQTFTLSGWWDYNKANIASHILVPESLVNSILTELKVNPSLSTDHAGSRDLYIMFANSWNIEQKMNDILAGHGYQSKSQSAGENYIKIGVNWGYATSQLASSLDAGTIAAVIVMLFLIFTTGFLIIYNIFHIAVMNEIRYYGLLKTIGTTPRQIHRMIRIQAYTLSLAGIPVGLAVGWGIGLLLNPLVAGQLNHITNKVSYSPLIFIFAALFSLVTVLLSCAKPAQTAGRVTPIEALHFTEKHSKKKNVKHTSKVSVPQMALSNIRRSHSKTVITVISLSLAVLILNMTVTFTNGFDMNKYLKDRVSDFILADAGYFQTAAGAGSRGLPQSAIEDVNTNGGITAGGRIYGTTGMIWESVTEKYFRSKYGKWFEKDVLDKMVQNAGDSKDGLLNDDARIYGMESFALDKLTVLEGNISDLYEPGSKSIAAVIMLDDYGKPKKGSHWAKPGDQVPLQYVDQFIYADSKTGKEVDPETDPNSVVKVLKSHIEIYTVSALVAVPRSLSYRSYGRDEFVMNDQTFIKDSGTNSILLYAFDTTARATVDMESYLKEYTRNLNPDTDYESKASYAEQFEHFRSMFFLLGGALSLIIGMVGILNFFNAILTGIFTRLREFAMLQAVGMTGKQLNWMLVCEGFCYVISSILLSLLLTLLTGPILSHALESVFWFYTYHLTVVPILILLPLFLLLGLVLPLLIYRAVSKTTIVERLRDADI